MHSTTSTPPTLPSSDGSPVSNDSSDDILFTPKQIVPAEDDSSEDIILFTPKQIVSSAEEEEDATTRSSSTLTDNVADNNVVAATTTQVNRRIYKQGSVPARILGLEDVEEGRDKSLSRMLFGSMFAYVLLGTWAWTTFYCVNLISLNGCAEAFAKPSAENVLTLENCQEVFTGSIACAHSIIFGLLSAVVVHETGSSDESATQRLSSIVKPVLKRRKKDANCLQQTLYVMIVSLPAVYVVSWTFLGLFCFIYSLSTPDGSSGPLFFTGQTWLGVSIKAAYSFFGVSQEDDSTISSLSGRNLKASPMYNVATAADDEEMGQRVHHNPSTN